jgi:hypothetical protein
MAGVARREGGYQSRGQKRDKSFHAARLGQVRFLSQQKRLLYRLQHAVAGLRKGRAVSN